MLLQSLEQKDSTDRDRTRTCNPQIRSLMPYPLGHTAIDNDTYFSTFNN